VIYAGVVNISHELSGMSVLLVWQQWHPTCKESSNISQKIIFGDIS